MPLPRYIREIFSDYKQTDFIIGEDLFCDVELNDANQENGFWYFRNSKKTLIKRFILRRGPQTDKVCVVTLTKNGGKFIPRFDFQIWNSTDSAVNKYNRAEIEENLIKAKVDLGNCWDEFKQLISFITKLENIDFEATQYAIVDSQKKELYENYTKEEALSSFTKKYGDEISEKDIVLLQNRRSKLDYFKKLLKEPDFFEEEKSRLKKTNESLWQCFFESNQWIFGYGLQLISCESLDEAKLETTVVGNDIVDGSGKRIDALLKTKGSISKYLFCEIKTNEPDLLVEKYPRPVVFVPGKELRGAVAQIQKTIHKVTLKLQENYHRPIDSSGNPTGEEILFVKPRGLIIIGMLDDFKTEAGINYEKLSSFELYRQQINGIEIITYDELYERVKFIVEEEEKSNNE